MLATDDTAERIRQVHEEASWGWEKPNDQLPWKMLRRLGHLVGQWNIPQTQKLPRRRWAMLAEFAAEQRSTLGIILIPSGGLPALAESFAGWPFATFAQNVARWAASDAGLLFRRYDAGLRKDERVASLEIPLLTENLVWLARHRAESLYSGGLTAMQAFFLAADAISRQVGPPPIEPPTEYVATRDSLSPKQRASRAIGAIKVWQMGEGPHPFL